MHTSELPRMPDAEVVCFETILPPISLKNSRINLDAGSPRNRPPLCPEKGRWLFHLHLQEKTLHLGIFTKNGAPCRRLKLKARKISCEGTMPLRPIRCYAKSRTKWGGKVPKQDLAKRQNMRGKVGERNGNEILRRLIDIANLRRALRERARLGRLLFLKHQLR